MTLTTTKANGRAYWRAQWTDANGHRHSKSLGRKDKLTRKQAMLAVARLTLDHDTNPGRAEAGKAPTLADWCDRYLDLQTDYSEGTVLLYRQTIGHLIAYFGGQSTIDRISRGQAAEWRFWLKNKGLADNTVAKHVANAKTIFGSTRGALKLDLLSTSPFDRESSARTVTHRPTFDVNQDVLARLLQHAPTPAWQALIGLCRLAGTRLGEALRLRWSDVDWDRRQLTIIAGRQTTKAKTRVTPLVPQLHDLLLAVYDRAPAGQVRICDGITAHQAADGLTGIRKAAQLPQWRDPFHTLRRCRSTEWLDEYGPALESAWLGHTYGVARDHYHTVTSATWDRVTGVDAGRQRIIDWLDRLTAEQFSRVRLLVDENIFGLAPEST